MFIFLISGARILLYFCRSFDEPRLQTLGADANFESRPVAHVDSRALKVDQPTAARMSVRVAHRISGYRTTPATLTNSCHKYSLLSASSQTQGILPQGIEKRAKTLSLDGFLLPLFPFINSLLIADGPRFVLPPSLSCNTPFCRVPPPWS
jgi:hypothetical protein